MRLQSILSARNLFDIRYLFLVLIALRAGNLREIMFLTLSKRNRDPATPAH